jgi:hypothetical protein
MTTKNFSSLAHIFAVQESFIDFNIKLSTFANIYESNGMFILSLAHIF